MTDPDWRELALTTITDPASAARRLLELSFSREVLWLALLVASLLNTLLLFGPSILLGQEVLLPAFLTSPITYFAVMAGGLALMIAAIYLIGRAMGGQGSVEAVASVMIWLQLVRDAVQAVVLVLQFLFPFFAILLAVAAAFYGLYVLLHFINHAHQFGTLGKSAVVLVASLLAIAMAMTILLTLYGGSIGDPSAYV